MKFKEIIERNTEYQIYCDMDGVLVDFQHGAAKLLGEPLGRHNKAKFWDIIHKMEDHEVVEFWESLPWIEDGKILWDYISRFQPSILTSPGLNRVQRIIAGKKAWIRENLRPAPSSAFYEFQKWRYAGPKNILIDDMAKQTIPWEQNGGIAIQYSIGDARKTIKVLQKQYGFER